MSPEGIMLSEESEGENKHHMMSLMWNIKSTKYMKNKAKTDTENGYQREKYSGGGQNG